MPQQNINNKKENLDIKKVFDFTKTLFASILRSRKGALVELARLSRFQKGTKGYERQYERLLPLIQELKIAFWDSVKENLPKYGLCLGIFDDSSIKKTGKLFPKQQVHHDHCSGSFYTGLKVFSSLIYQAGKTATIQSEIVGKEDNKLDVAKQHFDKLISYFAVDVFLFDSWYCKHPLISYIQEKKKNFISRIRCDSTVLGMEEKRIDKIVKHTSHKEYEHIKIHGKSYWIKEFSFKFKTYGELRVIASKEGQFDEPIFLVTNASNFSAKFVVQLYLRRFSIEIFFKDAKQYLNFETFFCRSSQKWELHLSLINILHWIIQRRYSISRVVRSMRENFEMCLLFINKNLLLLKFFEGVTKTCQI